MVIFINCPYFVIFHGFKWQFGGYTQVLDTLMMNMAFDAGHQTHQTAAR